jgi:hypothetical protein
VAISSEIELISAMLPRIAGIVLTAVAFWTPWTWAEICSVGLTNN